MTSEFNNTAIVKKEKLIAGEEFLVYNSMHFYGTEYGHLSLQGLATGGNVTVTIQLSNDRELGWIDFKEIEFTDEIMDFITIKEVHPCRYIQFSLKASNDCEFTLIPCFI